jgi:caffeoyl-CoA O-methyltransferase
MIVNPKIEKYLQNLHPKSEAILTEMENFGNRINFQIIGPLVGTVLYQYAKMIGAKRILELGSGFGYSAFWFSMGIPDDGKIYCSDFSTTNKEKAENYFKRAGIDHKIEFHVGDAFEIMEKLDGDFDIILSDIQKTKYPDVLKPALNKLRKGGLFLTDNVLWKGKVVETDNEDETTAIQKFNKSIFDSDEIITSILPIRDGLAVCVKK